MFITHEADLTHGQDAGVAKIEGSAQLQICYGQILGPGGQVHHEVKPLFISQSELFQCT